MPASLSPDASVRVVAAGLMDAGIAKVARWTPDASVTLLDALDAHDRGDRHRASPELRQRARAGELDATPR